MNSIKLCQNEKNNRHADLFSPIFIIQMQMYMFFLKKQNLIIIITILNNNCMRNECILAKNNLSCRFFLSKCLGRL